MRTLMQDGKGALGLRLRGFSIALAATVAGCGSPGQLPAAASPTWATGGVAAAPAPPPVVASSAGPEQANAPRSR